MTKKTDKFCVLDANILIYALNLESPFYQTVRGCLNQLYDKGYRFCVTEQIVREILVVLTQSRFVSKPLDSQEARRLGTHLLYQFVFLPSNNYSRIHLLELINQYQLSGKKIHDANIVAVMKAHGIREIMTYNEKDFSFYKEIRILK